MNTQCTPTWPEFNPAEFIFADFNYSQSKEKEAKKVILEIVISCLLFLLFVYSLHLIELNLNHRENQTPVFEVNPQLQKQESEKIYHSFQEGYLGQDSVNLPGPTHPNSSPFQGEV